MSTQQRILIAISALLVTTPLAFPYALLRTSQGQARHWQQEGRAVNISYRVEDGAVLLPDCQAGKKRPFVDLVNQALQQWEEGILSFDLAFSDGSGDESAEVLFLVDRSPDYPRLTGLGYDAGEIYGLTTFGAGDTPVLTGATLVIAELADCSAADPLATMVHEIGHLLGLDHSPPIELLSDQAADLSKDDSWYPTMLSRSEGLDLWARSPAIDDLAGLSALYARDASSDRWLSGYVRVGDASGDFGVLVVAFEQTSGRPLVSALTEKDGSFALGPLPIGAVGVAIEEIYDEDGAFLSGSYYNENPFARDLAVVPNMLLVDPCHPGQGQVLEIPGDSGIDLHIDAEPTPVTCTDNEPEAGGAAPEPPGTVSEHGQDSSGMATLPGEDAPEVVPSEASGDGPQPTAQSVSGDATGGAAAQPDQTGGCALRAKPTHRETPVLTVLLAATCLFLQARYRRACRRARHAK